MTRESSSSASSSLSTSTRGLEVAGDRRKDTSLPAGNAWVQEEPNHPWAGVKLEALSWPVVDSTDIKNVKVSFNAASTTGAPEALVVYDLFPVRKGEVLTTQSLLGCKPPKTGTFPKSKLKVENPQDLSFELRAKTASGKHYFSTNSRDRVIETNVFPVPELQVEKSDKGGVRVKMAPFGMGVDHYSVIARDEVLGEWLPEVLHDAPHPPRTLAIDINKTYTIRISGSTPSGIVVYRDVLWPQGDFQTKKYAGLLEGKGELHVPGPADPVNSTTPALSPTHGALPAGSSSSSTTNSSNSTSTGSGSDTSTSTSGSKDDDGYDDDDVSSDGSSGDSSNDSLEGSSSTSGSK